MPRKFTVDMFFLACILQFRNRLIGKVFGILTGAGCPSLKHFQELIPSAWLRGFFVPLTAYTENSCNIQIS